MFSLFKKVINTIKTANVDNNIDHGHVEEIKTIEHPEHKFNKLNLDRTPDPEVINKVENGPTILFMDDQTTSLVLFKIALKNVVSKYGLDVYSKFNVVAAMGPSAGTIAYKYILNHKVDMAVLDITIGEMIKQENNNLIEIDGIDIGIIINQHNEGSKVLYLSAHSLNRSNPLLRYYYEKYEKITNKSIEDQFLNKGDDNKVDRFYTLLKEGLDEWRNREEV